jgi:hypothetical protein
MHQSTYPFFGIWTSPSWLNIFIDFLYLRSLSGILHLCCACHPHQHWEKSHFTLWLYSLSSIIINLFSLIIIIMPSLKHVTQRKIQCQMPYSHQVLCLACQESCLMTILEWIPVMVDTVPLIVWLVLVALMKNFRCCQRIQQRQSYKLWVHGVNPQSPLKV